MRIVIPHDSKAVATSLPISACAAVKAGSPAFPSLRYEATRMGARPDEPQLPLYALGGANAVAAVAFAQVKSGHMCFKGIGSVEERLNDGGARFPGEIGALLLLDPAHEDYNAYMPQQLNEMRQAWDPDQAFPDELPGELIQFYRGLFAQEMADWPEEVREPLIERHVSPEWLRTGLQEASNVNQLYDEVRHAGPMPDVPLIVLCSMSTDAFKEAVSVGESESLLREEIEGKRRLYTALAASVPRGEVRPVALHPG